MNKGRGIISLLIIVFLFMFFSSCGTNKVATQSFKFSYCSSGDSYHNENFIMDASDDYPNLKTSNLLRNDLLMCKVLGISPQVDELFGLTGKMDVPSRMRALELKQKINQKISLAKTELDATISELDCEGERADLAAVYLDDLNSARDTKLTVGSVVIGALTTVATVMFKDDNTETAVGVSGGLISAGLGALTINYKGKKIEFYHPKNILSPIWKKQNTIEYPNFVWNIFQIEEFNSEENLSLLESTRKRWLQYVLKGEVEDEDERLFFGQGGDYIAEKLHLRSEMIDQIKSSTRYINQLLSIFESNLYKEYQKKQID